MAFLKQQRMIGLALTALMAGTGLTGLRADEPAVSGTGVIGTRMVDLDGQIHQLGQGTRVRPVAIVLLDTGCPIARRYAPELNEFSQKCQEQGVEFYAMLSDPLLTRLEAVQFRDEFQLQYPVLWDSAGDLALRLQPTHFPECFVISQRDELMYRGRIDNRFAGIGKLRGQVTQFELRDAVAAVADGQVPDVRFGEPVGCLFEAWDSQPPEQVDFNRHIAPIVYANCTVCHRQGSVAPFALENFEQTRRRADMLAYTTSEKVMPPWSAEPGFGHFLQERFLSGRQIALFSRWAETGRAEGDADNQLPLPEFPTGDWELGQPDIELVMEEPYEVPATGDDIYRYFVVSNPFPEDVLVTAMDFQPGDPAVVHHMNSFVDLAGRARTLDAGDDEPGFSVFGTGSFMEYDGGGESGYALGGWVPGMGPYRIREGCAVYIPAGGEIVIEIHYHLSGKTTKDQSRLALYLSRTPVDNYLDGTVMGTQNIDIDPGDAEYERYFMMEVPTAIDLIDVLPHMHYLGRSARVTATLPDGREVPIVNVDNWDFRWQSIYTLREPLRLPAGSRIEAWFRFDNSADNPANPSETPGRVRWGWGTTDEMAEVWLTHVTVDADESSAVYAAAMKSWLRSGSPDSRQPLDVDATLRELRSRSPWTEEGEALLLSIIGATNSDSIVESLKTALNKRPNDGRLLVAQATILAALSEFAQDEQEILRLLTAADGALDRAIEVDEYDWDAWMTRAAIYADSQEPALEDEAVEIFQQLLDGQEQFPMEPHYYRGYAELAELQAERGKNQSARRALTRGLKAFPRHPQLSQLLKQLDETDVR